MRQLMTVAAICAMAMPALASLKIKPIKSESIRYATYHLATREVTPTAGPVRAEEEDIIWASRNVTGYYCDIHTENAVPQGYPAENPYVLLDWGDIGTPGEGHWIGAFQFAYATDYVGEITGVIWFYVEENGYNSIGKEPVAGFGFEGLPGSTTVGDVGAWLMTVPLEEIAGGVFLLDGSDIDGDWQETADPDGFVDFGYSYYFRDIPDSTAGAGPFISGMANDPEAPGQEDGYDFYNDPNFPPPPAKPYVDTFWYGGNPFAQVWMVLYKESNDVEPECPNPGASGNYCDADIDGSGDCYVGLADLAKLLSNYLTMSGATHDDGDFDDDGDVDLADLAEMLGQYLDDCN